MQVSKTEFESRFNRMKTLNAYRLQLALSSMNANTRRIINILPILLHFNDPRLPGCREQELPYGIDNFSFNAFQRNYLQQRGIDAQSPLTDLEHYTIYGLYVMGSTATMAQGLKTDLDIWVAVSSQIPQEQLKRLAEKCHFICVWAKSQGVDLNLFVTPENRFTIGQSGILDTEDCGSAQSLFLLDEFYRTSMRLCGRYISWYMVSIEDEEHDYAASIAYLRGCDFYAAEMWFDYGSVIKNSAHEYFGSGLWLLYKAIDSPFKASLKILLMELYAHHYPQPELLSSLIKKNNIFKSSSFSLRLDAYYLLYKMVSKYLKQTQDTQRLELCRMAFFNKVWEATQSLESASLKQSRQKVLKRLTKMWRWSDEFIQRLCNKELWDISFVNGIESRLYASMVKSYRKLIDFSINNQIEYAITSDDAGILSRKLYAAFDRYVGKINLINSDLNSLKGCSHLTFIQPRAQGLYSQQWHLYDKAISSLSLLHTKACYLNAHLCQVVCWATLNRLINAKTHCYTHSGNPDVSVKKIVELSAVLRASWHPVKQQFDHALLQKPSRSVSFLVIVNFEHDFVALQDQHLSEYGTTLSFGKGEECLVKSIDVLVENSWGETLYHRLSVGAQGVIDLLQLYTQAYSINYQDKTTLPKIKILVFSKAYREIIRNDLELIIKQICACLDHSTRQYRFQIGHELYIAQANEHLGLTLTKFGQRSEELQLLSPLNLQMRPEYSMQVPPLLQRYASIGVMQYFFVPVEQGWDIYIVNERNEVNVYKKYQGSRAQLVNSINRFYTRQGDNSVNNKSFLQFNLPQYFVFNQSLDELHPFTIHVDYD